MFGQNGWVSIPLNICDNVKIGYICWWIQFFLPFPFQLYHHCWTINRGEKLKGIFFLYIGDW